VIHLDDDHLQRLAEGDATDPHLETCHACRSEVAAYRRLAARLSNLQGLDPPPGIAAEVMRRIDAASAAPDAALALLVAGVVSLALMIATWPGGPDAWRVVQGLGLLARIVRGTLLAWSGVPLLATALVVLMAAVSIRQLMKESRP
jgi:hypothetical protein